MAMAMLPVVALLLLGPLWGASAVLLSSRPGNVHTLILTDCHKYQDWQTIAAAYAWRDSGQPGSVTRVANCDAKDTAKYPKEMLDYVQTHMAPQFAWNEEIKDWYAAYNKPGAVVDWLKHVDPKEEWIVVLDSDMLLRRHFKPEQLPLDRGWALAAHYDYLKGVDNDLALRHVPEVAPRNDTLGGPTGRRGDRVGGPYYMHKEDLKKVAPLWLKYTQIMRTDMEAYKDSGDTAAKAGDRIWIAEMYGYSFGAAKANVWHKFDQDFMLYPGYTPHTMPRVIHYGLIYDVEHKGGTWQFDKHWYFKFDAHACPPWDMKKEKPQRGIFPPPPHPTQLHHKDYMDYYKDLIAIQTIALVNAGLCDYHVRHCPPSQQLKEVCEEAFALYDDIKYEIEGLEAQWHCTDHIAECKKWSERGECKKSEQYMKAHCRAACKFCTPDTLPERQRPPRRIVAAAPGDAATADATSTATPGGGGGAEAGAGVAAAAHAEQQKKEAEDRAAAAAAAKEKQESVAAQKQEETLAADQQKHQQQAAEKQEETKAKMGLADEQQAADAAATTTTADSSSSVKDKVDAAAAAAGGKAGGLPSEAEMRAKYSAATLKYAELVQRCTTHMKGLSDSQMKECIHAASFRLLFTTSPTSGAATTNLLTDSASSSTTQLPSATGNQAHDLAGLGALHPGHQGLLASSKELAGGAGTTKLVFLGGLVAVGAVLAYTRGGGGRRMFPRKAQHRVE